MRNYVCVFVCFCVFSNQSVYSAPKCVFDECVFCPKCVFVCIWQAFVRGVCVFVCFCVFTRRSVYLCSHVQKALLLCVFACVFVRLFLRVCVFVCIQKVPCVFVYSCVFTAVLHTSESVYFVYSSVCLRANTHAGRRKFCVFVCILLVNTHFISHSVMCERIFQRFRANLTKRGP